jgi:ribosomal protein L40E
MLVIIVVAHLSGEQYVARVLLFIGFIGLVSGIYTFLQLRRRLIRLRIELPPILTTIECRKCGFKTIREFQRGDYIFKEVDICQKCNEKMLITAIYREVHEKARPPTPSKLKLSSHLQLLEQYALLELQAFH